MLYIRASSGVRNAWLKSSGCRIIQHGTKIMSFAHVIVPLSGHIKVIRIRSGHCVAPMYSNALTAGLYKVPFAQIVIMIDIAGNIGTGECIVRNVGIG